MIGKKLGNRYILLNRVGGGGMAVVYKGRDTVLNRVVAVKVLRAPLTEDEVFIRRFRREAEAAGGLAHPNIVNIYDVGQDGEWYYIVMEYVEGQTMKEIIKAKGRLALPEVLEIGRQIARALVHAHAHQVIHRDIKPHNILITVDGLAKVTDFGIARASTGGTITHTDSILGSVHYVSPEQAKGDFAGEKSDLYSLGVVLYEALTGELPFTADSAVGVAMKHLRENPRSLRSLLPGFPQDVERLVMRVLEKDPRKRPGSASEYLVQLETVLAKHGSSFPTLAGHDFQGNGKTREVDGEVPDEMHHTVSWSKGAGGTSAGGGSGGSRGARGSGGRDGRGQAERGTVGNPAGKDRRTPRKPRTWLKLLLWSLFLFLLVGLITYGFYSFQSLLQVPEVEVPSLIGRSQIDAERELSRLGLERQIVGEEFHETYPRGTVVSQRPEAGTKVRQGRPVELILSKGRELGKVPELEGLSQVEAETLIKNENFEVGRIDQEYSDQVVQGIVTRQNPRAGLTTEKGSPIDLVVSLGPDRIQVPELSGKTVDAARLILQENRLLLGPVTEGDQEGAAFGTVFAQEPKAGEMVSPGTPVNIFVQQKKLIIPVIMSFQGPPDIHFIRILITDARRTSQVVHEQRYSRFDPDVRLELPVFPPARIEVYDNGILVKEASY